MRLINTKSLKLHVFQERELPQYAILSHRWEGDEVSFKDFSKGRNKSSLGYQKISRFCEKAGSEGYDWGWADTCCIDVRSSAELSESINSMFRWYAESSICYAYLSDVISDPQTIFGFEESRWFTRGWTLQEMIAPADVTFVDRGWNTFGTRLSLAETISDITGIRESLLYRSFVPGAMQSRCSIAERMSWAAKRETTRMEDLAYCLLGIFDINMTLLYGEGGKAFLRLQEEIIKISSDMSIFAWGHPADPSAENIMYPRGQLLADHAPDFSLSGEIRAGMQRDLVARVTENLNGDWRNLRASLGSSIYNMTHRGLQIDAHFSSNSNRALGIKESIGPSQRLLLLDCGQEMMSSSGEAELFLCAWEITPVRSFLFSQVDDAVFWVRDNEILHFVNFKDVASNSSNLQYRKILLMYKPG